MIVEFFEKNNGQKPAKDFLDSLDDKLAAKTCFTIDLLREYGHHLHMLFCEKLSSNIWELRTKQGSDITRVF